MKTTRQNLDAQLTAIRALYTNKILSAGEMLSDYPQLLTFSTTNDFQNACAAFTNAVNTYFKASTLIRARPANEVRLFNYDQAMAQREADFRLTLQDLKDSLVAGPQYLALDPDFVVDMFPQFDGTTTWRSLLPKFDGNAIELGSLPDLTFGGVIDGLTRNDLEGFFSKRFVMIPVARAPILLSADSLEIAFTTLNGHHYVLETSTNLVDWEWKWPGFSATNSTTTVTDAGMNTFPKRFYRLQDLWYY